MLRPSISYGLRLTLDKMSDTELAAIAQDLDAMFTEAAAEIERQTGTRFVTLIREAAEMSPRFKRDLLSMLEPRSSTQKFVRELSAEVDAAWRRLWVAQDEVERLAGPAGLQAGASQAAANAASSVSIYSEGIAPREYVERRRDGEGASCAAPPQAAPINSDLAYARVNMVIAKGELHALAEPTGSCRPRDVRAAYDRALRIEVLASTLEWIASFPACGDPLSGPIGHQPGAGGKAKLGRTRAA